MAGMANLSPTPCDQNLSIGIQASGCCKFDKGGPAEAPLPHTKTHAAESLPEMMMCLSGRKSRAADTVLNTFREVLSQQTISPGPVPSSFSQFANDFCRNP